MSALDVFPTLNCVYIGRPDRPLNLPRRLPFGVRSYLAQVVALLEPAEVSWCTGDAAERARTETRTSKPPSGPGPIVLVCSAHPGNVMGPAYWADPTRMRRRLRLELNGVMRGRTLLVVGYSVGDHLGILATDSHDVVRSVAAVASIGDEPLARISAGEHWRTTVHCQRGTRGDDGCLVRFRDTGETWAWGPGHHGRLLLDLSNDLVVSPAASTC